MTYEYFTCKVFGLLLTEDITDRAKRFGRVALHAIDQLVVELTRNSLLDTIGRAIEAVLTLAQYIACLAL